ncbi:MAG: VacJ family lipoprotein, partial [Victivallaceae bacterium]|nr:VacJ family lipoprotein [Victivallaceae bacterium]
MKTRHVIATMTAVFLAAVSGCASAPSPHEGPWTLSELENADAGSDPIEPFNRAMFAATDVALCYVIDPVGRIYATILPRPFIEHFDNVCENLKFPDKCIGTLLRGEFRASGEELLRFLINSSIGIAGIFDVADYWFDMPDTKSDFGCVFAAWGIGPGCTFVLPCLFRHNVRDAVGMLFDVALDLRTYIPYAGYATIANIAVMAERQYAATIKYDYDVYKSYRQIMSVYRSSLEQMSDYRYKKAIAAARNARKNAGLPPGPDPVKPKYTPKPGWMRGEWVDLPYFDSDVPSVDSFRQRLFRSEDDDYWFMKLSLFNRDFLTRGSTVRLSLDDDLPSLKCQFWETPKKCHRDRLAVVLPGIGATWRDSMPLALAELCNRDGYAVAVIDSAFSWKFAESRPDRALAGDLDRDARLLRGIISRLISKLESNGDLRDPELHIVGYSFGGLHALKIAAMEQDEPMLGTAAYVAINPPYDMRHACDTLKRMSLASATWNLDDARNHILNVAGLLVNMPDDRTDGEETTPIALSPISGDEADFAISQQIAMCLRNLLVIGHRDHGYEQFSQPYSWWRRGKLYEEADAFGMDGYLNVFLAQDCDKSPERLFEESSLRSFARDIAYDGHVRILHNIDDFLLTEEDRKEMDRTFAGR